MTSHSHARLPTGHAELTRALEVAFAGRATIGVPELAALIPMHRETIARHIAAGNLIGRLKGLGRTRRHRVFTIADIARFIQLLSDSSGSLPAEAFRAGKDSVRLEHGMRMTLPGKRKRN